MLEVADIAISFGGLRALDGVSLGVEKHEILGLIGPNGSGKTTFFNCLSGFVKPNAGKISFAGRSLIGLKPYQIAALGVGRTFQSSHLVKSLSVADNLMVARNMHMRANLILAPFNTPSFRKEEQAARRHVESILDMLKISHLKDVFPQELPIALRRTVEIGRAVALHPQLLLLDEPAAGLNNEETGRLAKVIREMLSWLDCGIILIEHDLAMVMNLCDRIAVLNFGRMIAQGSPAEVCKEPEVIRAYVGEDFHAQAQ